MKRVDMSREGRRTCFPSMTTSAFFKPVMIIATLGVVSGVAYGLYDLIRVPEYPCPVAGQPSIEVETGRRVVVGPSQNGEVCVLEGDTILGRSYDGSEWEQSTVAVEDFDCEANGNCTVLVPANRGKFRLSSYAPKRASTSLSEAARLLLQASFGPTQADLSSWGSKTPKEWITEQMRLPPSIHREYFRKRVSQRLLSHQVGGKPRLPCENLSRWNRHAFTRVDEGDALVARAVGGGKMALELTGIARVEIDASTWGSRGTSPFKICTVEEVVGGEVTFGDGDCSETILNPAIEFTSLPTSRMMNLGSSRATFVEMSVSVEGVRILKLVSGERLEPCSTPPVGPVFVENPVDGKLYQHDPRLRLLENTLEKPAQGTTASGPFCVSVPKTFLNKDNCVIGGRSCAPPKYSLARFTLDNTTIRSFFTEGGHYVYTIDGIPLEGERDLCTVRKNRYLKVSCDFGNDNDKVTPRTLFSIQEGFRKSTDTNPLIKDVHIGVSTPCDIQNTMGATFEILGECWRNVHSAAYNVYDMSRLVDRFGHLGTPYSIRRPAEVQGVTTLKFPASHPLSFWTFKRVFGYHKLGRFMDRVDFNKLPSFVQSEKMASFLGVTEEPRTDDDLTERCGSPGEVANDPTLGAKFSVGTYDYREIYGFNIEMIDFAMTEVNYKTATWVKLALVADDQLRQRMAFALSGIVVVTEVQVPVRENEAFTAVYDIFVRHAFGNYRDILKEISYSPMMAIMLTYLETKSFEYSLRQTGRDVFPDENYAREIMQLFSIGLIQLFSDGTERKDENGVLLETYTNEDIVAFSRAWTGFAHQKTRGNVDGVRWKDSFNYVDPMQIIPEYRDQFPKMDLYKGHLGDGYPLCTDFPERMFLRKGASWIYRGKNPLPTQDKDPSYLGANSVNRAILTTGSPLYNALCRPDGTGKCRYQSTVELAGNLVCEGIECEVDALRTAKVADAYYEFVRPACVRFPFFNNGKTVQNADGAEALCAHPEEIVAAEACCSPGTTVAAQDCLFGGERLTYAGAQARCSKDGNELCDFTSDVTDSCVPDGPHWTTNACQTLAKVSTSVGTVAIVHDPETGNRGSFTKENMRKSVREDSRNWFRVAWNGNTFPASENGCNGDCTLTEADECICPLTVAESPVFDSMPTTRQVLEKLRVGSLAPDVFDAGVYSLYEREGGVKAYTRAGGSVFDKDTIFEITDKGELRYFVNMESQVTLSSGHGFRNPANLMGIVKATVRDAQYETDALIDHLLYHRNCPPFIAYRIIQRFVTSNPSPRYVTACAKAFAEGSYEGFGSGKYGDLGALIAAVLLDKEARSTTLDSDPTHGQLREPLLKVIHMLRSLEATTRGNREFDLSDLHASIAQRVHFAPGVFSFFKPEYSPAGKVATAGLVAPEAQIFTGPTIVKLINGLLSLVRVGLSRCFDGLGLHYVRIDCERMSTGEVSLEEAPAMLTWTPEGTTAEEVVDELNLLLTADRLDEFTRAYIVDEFKAEARKSNFEGAVSVAKQLLIAAPEFHTTNLIQRSLNEERQTVKPRNGSRPFKAIVYLLLEGGMDSYNLIVPLSNCKNGKDMYQEYKDVRSDIALAKESLLEFDAPPGEQVCDRFGIHPNLPKLHQLYNQGDALFLANVGPLVEPVTREDVVENKKPVPQGLFAHNVQQQAVQTMFPQRRVASGVLGHMNDALFAQGFSTGAFSLKGVNQALEGDAGKSPSQTYMSGADVQRLDPFRSSETVLKSLEDLNKNPASSIFADSWSAAVTQTMSRTEELSSALSGVELEQTWTAESKLGRQLKAVATIIKARGALGTDRQTFYTLLGGFDTHSDVGSVLRDNFNVINEALTSFEEEMKLQGMWDDVLLIESSDFARTITSNGAGTDHGWGGNYFIVGGSVKGGTMMGEYPDDLTTKGQTNLGRGRILPTMSWDEVWNSIALWFGVDESRMDLVLPNKDNFADKLLGAQDVFEFDTPPQKGAEDMPIGIIVAVVVGVVGIAGLALFVAKFPKASQKGTTFMSQERRVSI